MVALADFETFRKEGVWSSTYPANVRHLYSPVDDVHGALKLAVSSAQHSLWIAMYGFDDQELADIVEAKCQDPAIRTVLTFDSSQAAGAHEKLILNREQFPNTSVAVGRSERGAIMHLKGLVVDDVLSVHGSTNWSDGGESLQDNELIVSDSADVATDMMVRMAKIHDYMLNNVPQPKTADELRSLVATARGMSMDDSQETSDTPTLYEMIRRHHQKDEDLSRCLRIIQEQQQTISALVGMLQPTPATRSVAGFVLSIGGQMGQSLTLSVDVANEEIRGNWVDDKGDVNPDTSSLPAGATIDFSSSDDTVVSVGAATATSDGTAGVAAPLTFSKAGTVTLTGEASDGQGNLLPGFTAQTVSLTLTPGAASGLEVSVDGAAPVPAPTPAP